jgi:putative transposase
MQLAADMFQRACPDWHSDVHQLVAEDNVIVERSTARGTQLIHRRGPWRGLDQVEIATLEWVNWFNNRRLHSACGDIPPAEYEQQHYRSITDPGNSEAAQPSLH